MTPCDLWTPTPLGRYSLYAPWETGCRFACLFGETEMPIRTHYRKRPRFTEPIPPRPLSIARLIDVVVETLSSLWLPLLVFLVPLLCYWPVLQSGFVSDDYFYHATFTYKLSDFIKRIVEIRAGDIQFPFFRPVAIESFRLDYLLWGSDAVGFHFSSLLLHSLNGVLLFFLARAIGLKRFGAATCALVFGLYPLNPEAVTWISGRFDVLAMTFILAAFLAWSASRLSDDVRWMIPSVIAFLLAALSKENAVAGVAILPLIDWALHSRTCREWGQGIGWNWRWYVVFFAVAVCVIAFRVWLFGDLGGYWTEHNRSAYLATQWSDIWRNFVLGDLWMLITPASRILWPTWTVGLQTGFLIVGTLVGLGLVAATVSASFAAAKIDTSPLVRTLLGALWILILLLPVATLEGVKGSLDYSRFLYIPAAGLAIWIGVAVDTGWSSRRVVRWITVILLVSALIFSGVALRRHNATWIEAGRIAYRIHAVMETYTASVPRGTTIYAVNFPWLWKGAHCAPLSYGGYVEFRHGITGVDTQVIRMEPEKINDWWDAGSSKWDRPGIGFVWEGSTQSVEVLPLFIPEPLSNERLIEFLGRPPR